MQTKGEYTAGPWELCDEGDYGDYDGQCRVILGETEPDLPIRIAVVLTGGSDEMQAENNANARLIAAAPELLEADEEALDTLEKLRADLAEENADLHAQRIAVIDLTIAQLRAALEDITFAEAALSALKLPHAGDDGWQDIATAPYRTPVEVRAGHMIFQAVLAPDAAMTTEEQSCDQWQAVHEGEHPPCWTDGACWESNEDGNASLHPVAWRPLPTPPGRSQR